MVKALIAPAVVTQLSLARCPTHWCRLYGLHQSGPLPSCPSSPFRGLCLPDHLMTQHVSPSCCGIWWPWQGLQVPQSPEILLGATENTEQRGPGTLPALWAHSSLGNLAHVGLAGPFFKGLRLKPWGMHGVHCKISPESSSQATSNVQLFIWQIFIEQLPNILGTGDT